MGFCARVRVGFVVELYMASGDGVNYLLEQAVNGSRL